MGPQALLLGPRMAASLKHKEGLLYELILYKADTKRDTCFVNFISAMWRPLIRNRPIMT